MAAQNWSEGRSLESMSRSALTEFAQQASKAAAEYYTQLERQRAQQEGDYFDLGDDFRDPFRGVTFVRDVDCPDILDDSDAQNLPGRGERVGVHDQTYLADEEDGEANPSEVDDSDGESSDDDEADAESSVGDVDAVVERFYLEWVAERRRMGCPNPEHVDDLLRDDSSEDDNSRSFGLVDEEHASGGGDGGDEGGEPPQAIASEEQPSSSPQEGGTDACEHGTLAGAAGIALRRMRRSSGPARQ